MATAAGASYNIQQASLEELQPEYGPGNLRAPFGDKVGVKLLSRVPQDVVTGQGSRLETVQAGLPCNMFQVATTLRNMDVATLPPGDSNTL